jgi:hypothetical protein
MAFCQKCGSRLSEGSKFCAGCGAAVNQADNAAQSASNAAGAVSSGITRPAERLSPTPIMLGAGAGFSLIFLYNLINYLGAWSLTFLNFFSALLTPALFALLIFTQAKNSDKHILFIAPFGLRALLSIIFLLRSITSMSLPGLLVNIVHIAIGVLFIMTVFGKLDGKKILPILSGAAAVVLGAVYFRYGFLSGLAQTVYFGSVMLLSLGTVKK